MISEKMQKLVNNNSVIRQMFEEGNRLAQIYGKENVYDFSLGNPNVEAPKEVNDAIKRIVDEEDPLLVHGYMSNSGFEDVRSKIANSINKKYNTNFTSKNLVMTVGAASGLNIVLKSILNRDDEVIVFAPYFSEYNNYIENYDGIVRVVNPDEKFLPNLEEFKNKINSKTKAIIMNSPNNPTGVIYPEEFIIEMCTLLKEKETAFNTEIYLISDEPYREIVYYKNVLVPYITNYYDNSFVVYSYSKSLSLPGERIGYVVISEKQKDYEKMVDAVTISNRIIGSVNAPSLIQRVIPYCLDCKVDIDYYDRNRKLLLDILTQNGFEVVKPEGAFYLFVKTPIDDKDFCQVAKEYNILVVPGSSFAYSGYVRIAYCVSYEMIEKSRNAFNELSNKLGMKKDSEK